MYSAHAATQPHRSWTIPSPVPAGISAIDVISTRSTTPLIFMASRIMGWRNLIYRVNKFDCEYLTRMRCGKNWLSRFDRDVNVFVQAGAYYRRPVAANSTTADPSLRRRSLFSGGVRVIIMSCPSGVFGTNPSVYSALSELLEENFLQLFQEASSVLHSNDRPCLDI